MTDVTKNIALPLSFKHDSSPTSFSPVSGHEQGQSRVIKRMEKPFRRPSRQVEVNGEACITRLFKEEREIDKLIRVRRVMRLSAREYHLKSESCPKPLDLEKKKELSQYFKSFTEVW